MDGFVTVVLPQGLPMQCHCQLSHRPDCWKNVYMWTIHDEVCVVLKSLRMSNKRILVFTLCHYHCSGAFCWLRKWSCNGHKPTYRLVVGIANAKGIGPTRLSQLEMSASQSSVWMQSHTLWWCVGFYSWFVPLFYFMLGVYTQFIPWNPTITQLQGIRITQPLIFGLFNLAHGHWGLLSVCP